MQLGKVRVYGTAEPAAARGHSLRDTMKVHYALAAMAASASALIAPAAMPRALVARPAPTADATVLEVPRPRPLFEKSFEMSLAAE